MTENKPKPPKTQTIMTDETFSKVQDLIEELRKERDALKNELIQIRKERDDWKYDAEREGRNSNYYRGLVDKCGDYLGLQGDGGCGRIPGLVKLCVEERDYWRTEYKTLELSEALAPRNANQNSGPDKPDKQCIPTAKVKIALDALEIARKTLEP